MSTQHDLRLRIAKLTLQLAAVAIAVSGNRLGAQGIRSGSQGAISIITGTITGPNAVIIAGATISATSPDSVTRRAASNDNGKYQIIFNSGAAVFQVMVTAPGYQPWSGEVRKAYNDDRIVLDVRLRPGPNTSAAQRPALTPAVIYQRSQLGTPDAISVTIDSGDVLVRGTNSDQVVYHTYSHSFRPGPQDTVISMPKEIAPTGTQAIGNLGLTIAASGSVALVIEVPRNLARVQIKITSNGFVRASDLDGQLSVESASGDVTLDRISGPALVEARNGAITASIATIPNTMNFLGHNGAVTITLPPDARANVSTEVHQGAIFHDSTSHIVTPPRFDVPRPADLQLYLEAHRVDMPAAQSGNKSSWIMNGGGAAITVTSLNGNIIIRRPPPKQE